MNSLTCTHPFRSPRERELNSQRAFTLIELALVLLVLSLLASGILAIMAQKTRQEKMAEVDRKMDVIEAALKNFVKQNGRLPCPAPAYINNPSNPVPSYNNGTGWDALWGYESYGIYSAYYCLDSGLPNGIVPIRTLGLSDDYAFDPWGNAFSYVVDQGYNNSGLFTSPGAFTTGKAWEINNAGDRERLHIIDINDNLITGQAIAVIISHGPNGHGAAQANGIIKSSGSDNIHEWVNCLCDNNANPTYIGGGGLGAYGQYYYNMFNGGLIVYQHAPTSDPNDPLDSFDDIVRYYRREDFLTASDLQR